MNQRRELATALKKSTALCKKFGFIDAILKGSPTNLRQRKERWLNIYVEQLLPLVSEQQSHVFVIF